MAWQEIKIPLRSFLGRRRKPSTQREIISQKSGLFADTNDLIARIGRQLPMTAELRALWESKADGPLSKRNR
jgi:hypothetical protein